MSSTQQQIPPETEMIDTSSRKREVKRHGKKNTSSKKEECLEFDSDEEVKGTEIDGLNQTVKDKRRKEQQRKDLIQQAATGRFTIVGTVPLPQKNSCAIPNPNLIPALNISIVGRFLIIKAMGWAEDQALAVIRLRRIGKRRRGRPAIG